MQAERAVARPVDREHERKPRQLAADFGKLGEALCIGDDGFHTGVLQPVAQRIDAEQDRKRHRDRAELVDRDMPGGRLRRLRQQHRDAVAARDAFLAQRVCEPVGGLAQPAERDLFGLAVGADVQDREPAWVLRGPLVADIDADVVTGEFRPAEVTVKLIVVADVRQHEKVLVVRF